MFKDILQFWFEEIDPKLWWLADNEFDETIRSRFLPLLEQAARAELFPWRHKPAGRLAEIIVLDQFSRNIYRNTPQAFAHDAMALVLAQEAVATGAHQRLSAVEASFLLMPYMHSESPAIHAVAKELFQQFATPNSCEFELKHKAIIDRFGRYPHRNDILGRASSAEEVEFLKQPGSGF